MIRKLSPESNEPVNLLFKTGTDIVDEKQMMGLTVTMVDDEMQPISKPLFYEIDMTEEEYHRALRKDASKVEQLITSNSTDPEWNPEGYVKNLHNGRENQEGQEVPETEV